MTFNSEPPRRAVNAVFESMRTGVIFDDAMGRVTPYSHVRSDKGTTTGIDFCIERTWDGQPVDHKPIRVHMEWVFERVSGKPHKRAIRISFEAPLFDDPDPPEELPGICPGLWNYEVVEFFFASPKNQYLEVEVGPHGHWLCILHDGIRMPFNCGEDLQLEVQNTFRDDSWFCVLDIPLAYLPAGVETFNAYGIHGSGENRTYEALTPVTDGTHEKPDFHRLNFFNKIDLRKIVPEGFNNTSFNDLKYGDLWEGR